MSRQTIAVSVKASKLTARALAYVVAAVGRKIAKEHRKAQTPHGKQSVRKLMGHGGDTNAIEVDTPKLFDKVAWTTPSAVWGMKNICFCSRHGRPTPSQAALPSIPVWS